MIAYVWTAWQYRDVFDAFYESCDARMQVEIDQRLSRLLDGGNLCREPISKPVDDGIFELRANSATEHARLLFYFDPGKRIIFVVAAYKDQRKLSRRLIDQAKKIREILRTGKEISHGLYKTN